MKKTGAGSQKAKARSQKPIGRITEHNATVPYSEHKATVPYSEFGISRQRVLKAVFLLTPDSWLLDFSSLKFSYTWFILWLLLPALLLFSCPQESFGADKADDGHVYAIQNRVFHSYHEIGASIGYFPDDDFYNLYPLGLQYTFHINEHLAWEVARGYLVLNQEKNLRKDLEKKFGVAPVEFRETRYMIHTHLVVKPFYGKDAVWNRGILNHEGYFFLGPGIVSYESRPNGGSENVFSASFGYGVKYFIYKHLCLNFEIRDMVNFREDHTENILGLGLGLGVRFNLVPRKTDRDKALKVLQNYLREDEKP